MMEVRTKYNVADYVWIMRNNKPEKIQISNIEIEVHGVIRPGTIYLNGECNVRVVYVEVQRDEYRSFGDKEPVYRHNERDCYKTKRELLNSFLDDEDGKESEAE